MKFCKKSVSAILAVAISATMFLSGCGAAQSQSENKVSDSENLMVSLKKSTAAPTYDFLNDVTQPKQYNTFASATADFSINLLKQAIADNSDNTVVSPLSVALALGIVENGAGSTTATEFKKLLGNGQLSVEELNNCYSYISSRLTNFNDEENKLNIANSIWLKNDIDVKRSFLQKGFDFFDASIFSVDFSAANTAHKINGWVKDNTNGLIDSVVKETDPATLMYILNTIAMEANWSTQYNDSQISNDTFTTLKGDVAAQYMQSTERYIKSDKATGFIKNIDVLPCKFVAILPNEKYTIDSYLDSITGEEYLNLFSSTSATDLTNAYLPTFKYKWENSLTPMLQNMGLITAFTSDADFGNMTKENCYINDVYHSAYVEVSPIGIKAGAATSVEIDQVKAQNNSNTVKLNRPFIYAIIDNESNLPIFIGTVTNPLN